MMNPQDLFVKSDLVPVVIQDSASKEVLMVGYTNQEAFDKTRETQTAWFWSRSRKRLWQKGETSKNFLFVQDILVDCDKDTLLYLCRPAGPTCHTGQASCFYQRFEEDHDNG